MSIKKTFTLIEMLIVVVIIGILAAALIPRLQSVQARARDTKRKADIHQIATALGIYKEDHGGSYNELGADWVCGGGRPISTPNTYATLYHGRQNYSSLYTILGKYMTAVPTDSNQTQWRANGDCYPDNDPAGYFVIFMNRKAPNGMLGASNAITADSFVLAASTESDGSSSNWVTSSNGFNTSCGDCVLGDSGDPAHPFDGTRIGAIDADHFDSTANNFDTYMCSTVTFTGGITVNDGSGHCYANSSAGDIRYIYVQ